MEFIFAAIVIILAFFTGKLAENRHYKSIKKREAQFRHIPAVSFKLHDEKRQVEYSELVTGSVVISIDHFKRLMMRFRQIFGGEIQSYSSLIDRGRREALLRMKEWAPDADVFLNCRLETASISKGEGKAIGCVEVIAYATAVKYKP